MVRNLTTRRPTSHATMSSRIRSNRPSTARMSGPFNTSWTIWAIVGALVVILGTDIVLTWS